MKKITTIILSFIFGITMFNTAQAQYKNNSIKVNLVGPLAGQYQIAYERALNENISAQLSAGYITRKVDNSDSDIIPYTYNMSGFILIPEGRYYFTEGLKGFYAGAFARVRMATEKMKDLEEVNNYDWSYTDKRSAIGGGLVLGAQAIIGDAIVFDIFLGPQYKAVSSSRTYDNPDDADRLPSLTIKGLEKSGVGIRFGFNVGVAF